MFGEYNTTQFRDDLKKVWAWLNTHPTAETFILGFFLGIILRSCI